MQTRGSTLQDSPPHPPHDANSKPTTSATTSVQNKYRTPAKYAASKDPRERTKKSGKQKHTHTHTLGFFLSFYDALLGHPLRLLLQLLLLLLRRRHHRRKRRAPIHRQKQTNQKKKTLIQFQSSDLKNTRNRACKDEENTPPDP
jgi:hypothetical protein